jgi:hypothetical protein
MKHAPLPAHLAPARARRRCVMRAGLLLLALAAPAGAHPCSLDELLEMSLEQLLQVDFTPQRAPQTDGGSHHV